MFLVSYIWSYNLKANHNKDYSVVKTFKAVPRNRDRFFHF